MLTIGNLAVCVDILVMYICCIDILVLVLYILPETLEGGLILNGFHQFTARLLLLLKIGAFLCYRILKGFNNTLFLPLN